MDNPIEQHVPIDHTSVLKEYYARYLTEVRGNSPSSVKHYLDGLNNISRRLQAKGLVEHDIYEVLDLDHLKRIRSILYADPDFIALNKRGNSMYSSALNHYCDFAFGEGFHDIQSKITAFDVPVAPEASVVVKQSVWRRSEILRVQAIELAGYSCEMDAMHQTFISEASKKPFMEGHHALPMNSQEHFTVGLDVYANIICLCPVCHRRIHHGLKQDRIDMAKRIFDQRIPRLKNCGIHINEAEFVEIAARL